MTSTAPVVVLLTTATVTDYLIERGLIGVSAHPLVTELDGGISNIVLAVDSDNGSWVVKQSLPRLRVAQEWVAKQERTINEANGLRVAATITPSRVPGVVHLDAQQFVLIIERAPLSWTSWKQQLMTGEVDVGVARSLGATLGAWHAGSAAEPQLVDQLDDPEAFEQLRIGPYYRATAERLPEVAAMILAVVDRMRRRRTCLVHGDFSPKNILVGPDGFWVLDFEVAHRGDPDFDRAFLLTHLLLKAVHRPADHLLYRAAAEAFLTGYDQAFPEAGHRSAPTDLSSQLGCLLLARTDGKSPAEYLDDQQRATVRALGAALLKKPPSDALEAFSLVTPKRHSS